MKIIFDATPADRAARLLHEKQFSDSPNCADKAARLIIIPENSPPPSL